MPEPASRAQTAARWAVVAFALAAVVGVAAVDIGGLPSALRGPAWTVYAGLAVWLTTFTVTDRWCAVSTDRRPSPRTQRAVLYALAVGAACLVFAGMYLADAPAASIGMLVGVGIWFTTSLQAKVLGLKPPADESGPLSSRAARP